MTTTSWRAVPDFAEIVVIFVFSQAAGSVVALLDLKLYANSAPRYVMNVQRYASVMPHIMLCAARVQNNASGARTSAAK
jgi:hypothetical protein